MPSIDEPKTPTFAVASPPTLLKPFISSEEEAMSSELPRVEPSPVILGHPEHTPIAMVRRWPRSHLNLPQHGLRPVWTSWDGYPDENIPDDIREAGQIHGILNHIIPV